MNHNAQQTSKFMIDHFDSVLVLLLSHATRFLIRSVSFCFFLSVVAPFQLVSAMVVDSISGAINSVVVSTGSRPVVTDACFIQSIFAVEFISTRAPVMSELSRVLNMFPIPAMQDNLFRPTYHWNVPTHPSEEFVHLRDHDSFVVTAPVVSEFEYFEQYLTSFDVGCFCHMGPDGNDLQVRDRFSERLELAVAAWAKHRNHWGGGDGLSCRCVVNETDYTFVRGHKEGD